MLFTASHLNVSAENIYETITKCVARTANDSEHKKTFMKSIWQELVDHLRDVQNMPNFKIPAMKAISEYGKYLMKRAFNKIQSNDLCHKLVQSNL